MIYTILVYPPPPPPPPFPFTGGGGLGKCGWMGGKIRGGGGGGVNSSRLRLRVGRE